MARIISRAASLLLPVTLCCGAPLPAGQVAPPSSPPAPGDITVSGRAEAPSPPLVGPDDFVSPMGEPFRSTDKLSGAEHWFAQADANANGRLTLEEFQADAARFFTTLDVDGDGTIGPDELQRYETKVAPEVTVTSTYGNPSKATTDSDGKIVDPPYPTRLGAGRFGYLASPEPVAAADANLDRGVTRAEFTRAAAARFKVLDTNGDGAITRSELPKLGSPREG